MTAFRCSLSLEPARLATGTQDETSLLVLADGRIVAVLVRLDDPCHGEDRGRWFLEVGFGRCAGTPAPFGRIVEALRWITARLGLVENVDAAAARAEHALAFTATGGIAAASPQ